MKRLILFVCLFFFSTSIYCEEMNRLDIIEKELDSLDVISTSKELNTIYNDLYKEQIQLEDKIQDKRMVVERLDQSCDYCDSMLNEYKQEMSMNLCLYQLSRWNDFKCDIFNDIYFKRKTYLDKRKNVKKEIQSIYKQKESIEIDMKRIDDMQRQLSLRYNEHDMNGKGKPNAYSTIQGTSDLPVYGGPTDSKENQISCLAYGNYSIDETSENWMFPIQNGYMSAGTWAYPDGKMHLGMDIAISMYSNLYAPLNGIVLYADACTDSDNGYLGNWVGWPLGGGNTICMIGSYQNQLYAFSFCHLSNDILVYPGQQIRQGDIIALTGNSGNSTGPHCHMEVFTLQCSMEEAIAYFIETSDFSFGNGYNTPATCSNYACRIRPESVWG